ncbi:hypothetical protein PENSTE_c021G09946 [Penicillium steckii]|uniref:Uncharacterized protein n=1 Tax=Penicillium steckii TaxID=303698 RepID=A0A1V6STE9_9EURO|nr:hypothetical protein PENSTE_c021G09946 [Penicillium steckii]
MDVANYNPRLGELPFFWILAEVKNAGLKFDEKFLENIAIDKSNNALQNGDWDQLTELPPTWDCQKSLPISENGTGPMHHEVDFGHGWSPLHVCKQRLKNMVLTRTVSHSEALRRGQREIPANALVHSSVIHRRKTIPTYRPSNLIIGDLDALHFLNKGSDFNECFIWKPTSDMS